MKRKASLLIVDDEPNIRKILQAAFERAGYSADTAGDGEEALRKLTSGSFDLLLTDVLMPGMSGVEILRAAKKTHPGLAVLVMTAYGTIPQAVEAMREGAADYITKPFDLESLKKSVASWLPKKPQTAREAPVPDAASALDGLIASSAKMREVLELVKQVANARATVLITGESGSGKEVIARAIHRSGSRFREPFVAVSCAALPETLLESELFGHEKGAYTGADSRRAGRFEVANLGTLFLDEIGEVPLSVQVKLLRVLQEREFERLGGTKPIQVDVRLIAATNRDLNEAVKEGSFREELLYRLQVLTIELPPLRERMEDVEPLARHFLAKFARANGSSVTDLNAEAVACLLAYGWPGNVRELENVIERAVVLAAPGAELVTAELLPQQLRNAA